MKSRLLKYINLITVVVLLAGLLPLFINKDEVSATNYTYSTTSSSSYLSAENAVYNTAQTAVNGTLPTGSSGRVDLNVGQYLSGGIYGVQRTYLYFSTTSLPTNIVITSAYLYFYGYTADLSATDFNIQIVQGNSTTYPHDPLVVGDFDKTNYNFSAGVITSGGSFNTVNYSINHWNKITLNASGISWIKMGSTTKLVLISENDGTMVAPLGNEFVTLVNNDMSKLPYLSINYSPLSNNYVNVSRAQVFSGYKVAGTGATIVGVTGTMDAGVCTITDGTGTLAVSPTTLLVGVNSPVVNVAGTFTVVLPPNHSGTVSTGGWTVTGSPVTLTMGSNTITVQAGGAGSITITITKLLSAITANACSNVSLGTFNVYLPSGMVGTANSGTTTVSGSPKPLSGGTTVVTTTAGAGGTITIYVYTDMLIVAESFVYYINSYPSKLPADCFQLQLDTDNDPTNGILAASPIQNWGDRPSSIYLNPSYVQSYITYGSAYYVRLYGYNITETPSDSYQLLPIAPGATQNNHDWYGVFLRGLDYWAVATALSMEYTDNISTYLTVLSNGTQVIDTATSYFVSGVPDISNVRPNLFTTSELTVTFPSTTANNNFDDIDPDTGLVNANAWQKYVGTNIAADLATFAVPMGTTGKSLGVGIIWLVVVLAILYSLTNGAKPLGALLICIPFLWIGVYFRIVPIQQIVIPAILFFIAFVRQFIIKTT